VSLNSNKVNDAKDVAFVTVTTSNFAYRAFALMDSVSKYVPQATQLICSADGDLSNWNPCDRSVVVLDSKRISVPRYPQLVFGLNPTGVCCLLKPFAVLKALELPNIRRVVYLDNDIGLFGSPSDLLEKLRSHSFVLTPHHLGPLPETARPNESVLFTYGTYNAGLFAVANCTEAKTFLGWWANWLTDPRHLKRHNGYDQVWLNYVPVMCDGSAILRHPGYNVAFWNLCERDLHLSDDRPYCKDKPLIAYHFSNFDESRPGDILPDDLVSNCPRGTATRWLANHIANDWNRFRTLDDQNLDYMFSLWADGVAIKEEERERARQAWDSLPPDFDPWTADGADCIDGPFLEFKSKSNVPLKKMRQRTWVDTVLDLSARKLLARVKSFKTI
jgi:hypothetical protein